MNSRQVPGVAGTETPREFQSRSQIKVRGTPESRVTENNSSKSLYALNKLDDAILAMYPKYC